MPDRGWERGVRWILVAALVASAILRLMGRL
jgi:hypothetical protein